MSKRIILSWLHFCICFLRLELSLGQHFFLPCVRRGREEVERLGMKGRSRPAGGSCGFGPSWTAVGGHASPGTHTNSNSLHSHIQACSQLKRPLLPTKQRVEKKPIYLSAVCVCLRSLWAFWCVCVYMCVCVCVCACAVVGRGWASCPVLCERTVESF